MRPWRRTKLRMARWLVLSASSMTGIITRLGSGRRGAGMEQPVVGVVMGSESDWEVMRAAVEHLQALSIPCEQRVVSAHRTPDLLFEYAA
ncbi:MAG: AIR carboxylase family protein, partial [Acidithiobacillus sp.]